MMEITKRWGPVAQLVEQRPFKPRVPGSSPGGPSNFSTPRPRGVLKLENLSENPSLR